MRKYKLFYLFYTNDGCDSSSAYTSLSSCFVYMFEVKHEDYLSFLEHCGIDFVMMLIIVMVYAMKGNEINLKYDRKRQRAGSKKIFLQ